MIKIAMLGMAHVHANGYGDHVARHTDAKIQCIWDDDPARGKALYTPCTACHGPDGNGNEQVKAPPLNHASDWYLLAQLKKFKDHVRGGNAIDIEGAQMIAQVTMLKDEQAMKDVLAHIATLRR